jgi:hypothetical protein
MPFDEPWYLESQAEAYAILELTNRADVRVTRTPRLPGLDLLLSLTGSSGQVRHFGVVIVPRVIAAEPASIAPERIERDQEFFGEIAFPVLMLSFAADEPAGEFRWIAEPQIQSGRPMLMLNPSREFRPLTRDVLPRVFRQIEQWYERRADQVRRVPVGVSALPSSESEFPRRRRTG